MPLLTFDASRLALDDAEREKKLRELLADEKKDDKAGGFCSGCLCAGSGASAVGLARGVRTGSGRVDPTVTASLPR